MNDDELEQLLRNLKLRRLLEIVERELERAEQEQPGYGAWLKRLLREDQVAPQLRREPACAELRGRDVEEPVVEPGERQVHEPRVHQVAVELRPVGLGLEQGPRGGRQEREPRRLRSDREHHPVARDLRPVGQDHARVVQLAHLRVVGHDRAGRHAPVVGRGSEGRGGPQVREQRVGREHGPEPLPPGRVGPPRVPPALGPDHPREERPERPDQRRAPPVQQAFRAGRVGPARHHHRPEPAEQDPARVERSDPHRQRPPRGPEHVVDLGAALGRDRGHVERALPEPDDDDLLLAERLQLADLALGRDDAAEPVLTGQRGPVLALARCSNRSSRTSSPWRTRRTQPPSRSSAPTTSWFTRTSRPSVSTAVDQYRRICSPVGWNAGGVGQGRSDRWYWKSTFCRLTSGYATAQTPPTAGPFSNTTGSKPSRPSTCAWTSPEIPPPTIATRNGASAPEPTTRYLGRCDRCCPRVGRCA